MPWFESLGAVALLMVALSTNRYERLGHAAGAAYCAILVPVMLAAHRWGWAAVQAAAVACWLVALRAAGKRTSATTPAP